MMSQAEKYFKKGMRQEDPLGFDDYAKLERITGVAAPVIQQFAKSSDAALRLLISTLYGGAGAVGDLTGSKSLGRDLAAIIESGGGMLGMGPNTFGNIGRVTKVKPVVADDAVTVYRGEKIPKFLNKKSTLSKTGDFRPGAYHSPDYEVAAIYANQRGFGFPVIKKGIASKEELLQGIKKNQEVRLAFDSRRASDYEGTLAKYDGIIAAKKEMFPSGEYLNMPSTFKSKIDLSTTLKNMLGLSLGKADGGRVGYFNGGLMSLLSR